MSGQELQSVKGSARYPRGLGESLKSYFFKGVALGGGKTNKTAVANVEYFIDDKKIFLHSLKNKIKTENDYSSDQQLFEYLNENTKELKYIAVNSSLGLPKCITCQLACPGYENCKEDEILWLWNIHRELQKKNSNKKLFTPYTERCAEVYISNYLEEKFNLPHALGANMAPLTARTYYLRRRMEVPFVEVNPKLSLWRIGRSLGIQKSYLRFHKHAIRGEETRAAILKQLINSGVAFIYEDDKKVLVEDNTSFEAFICALTAVLKYKNQVEDIPKDFPANESWIDFPKKEINWN